MKEYPVIAMDGPGGVGKSSTARVLAGRLGYFFLSTGLIYRALAWCALKKGWAPGETLSGGLLNGVRVEVGAGGGVRVNGEAVAEALSAEEISRAASVLSTLPEVREFSNRVQRDTVAGIAASGAYPGVILEGRDIGSVVFPEARHKFFITASPAERARRRFEELRAGDPSVTLEQVAQTLEERDARDENRAIAPLKPAEGARVIDTSALTLEQVVEALLREME